LFSLAKSKKLKEEDMMAHQALECRNRLEKRNE
jgi:hypothetical protein